MYVVCYSIVYIGYDMYVVDYRLENRVHDIYIGDEEVLPPQLVYRFVFLNGHI